METEVLHLEDRLDVEEINRAIESVLIAESRAPYGNREKGYRDLRVYQEALKFVADCYRHTQSFPKQEQFGLTNQLRRAAVSVLVNIAEGWGRNGKAEFARFIDIAIGSLCEVEYLFEVSAVLGYVPDEDRHNVGERSRIVGAMLHKLRTHLRK